MCLNLIYSNPFHFALKMEMTCASVFLLSGCWIITFLDIVCLVANLSKPIYFTRNLVEDISSFYVLLSSMNNEE